METVSPDASQEADRCLRGQHLKEWAASSEKGKGKPDL